VIGTKTLSTLALVGLVAAVARLTGLLRPDAFLALDGRTAFVLASFAVVVGTVVFRFWRVGERSAHYLRFVGRRDAEEDEVHCVGGDRYRVVIGENHGEAFDLGPRAQHVACVALFLLLGLVTLDRRAVDLLATVPERLEVDTSEYCSLPSDAPAAASPSDPGCALIRRAYALGYAKDLGSCAPKEREASQTACTRRQRDEPFLHFAWRRLREFYRQTRGVATADYFAALAHEFEARTDGLATLYATERELIASTPRASHHVFTNLPEPPDSVMTARGCLERTRHVGQRVESGVAGATRGSRIFEHIVVQLMFEGRYEPAAGSCREFQIHWGAPTSACADLARSPEVFLAAHGAGEHLHAALGRRKVALALRELDARTGRERGARAVVPAPEEFVSLSCYIEEPRAAPARRFWTVRLEDQTLAAIELRVPPTSMGGDSLHIDRYGYVASLLARGFHYGAVLSDAGIDVAAAGESVSRSLVGNDFLLTRLYGLESVDVFVAPDVIAARADLLEVYPYYVHLRNYVHLFRLQYEREHARL